MPPTALNDAGGFRNVLPAGQAGTDNALQLAQFQADGTRPDALGRPAAALRRPALRVAERSTPGQSRKYFKDATFGVKPDDVASTERPRPGVTIVRDKQYGVPHIYGDTREDVHVRRRLRGRPGPAVPDGRPAPHAAARSCRRSSAARRATARMDRTQWAIAPYTEADLQLQIDNAEELYGADGPTARRPTSRQYVAGINAVHRRGADQPDQAAGRVRRVRQDARSRWKVHRRDRRGVADRRHLRQGRRRARCDSALALQAFEKRFGAQARPARVAGLPLEERPRGADHDLTKRFPYQTRSPFSKRGLALPDPGSVELTPPRRPARRSAARPPRGRRRSFGAQLLRARSRARRTRPTGSSSAPSTRRPATRSP